MEHEPKQGFGGQQGSGAKPMMGSGAKPPEAENFLSIFIQKKWPKVEDFNENLPP